MSILNRILAATDFSPAGHAGLARAGQLAAQHGAELQVIHATPDWALFANHMSAHQEHYGLITQDAERKMAEEISWLMSSFAVRARGEVHRGRASRTILRAIEAYRPHLLVIGAHGESAATADASALGGTALRLITPAMLPTLLVRNPEPMRYRISLAAVRDAEEQSRRIVRWSSALASGGVCHIVRAFNVPYLERLRLANVGAAVIDIVGQDQEKIARQETETLLSAVDASTQAFAHVICGPPLPGILIEISGYGPQLIVVGQNQHCTDDTAQALIVSCGLRLAYHAPCDVLVVP